MVLEVHSGSRRVSDDSVEEEEPFLKHTTGLSHYQNNGPFISNSLSRWRGTCAVVLYVLSGIIILACSRFPTERQCTLKMSTWSPMLEAVEYEWQYWDVLSPSSKYIGKPNQEIEKEWDYLWQYGTIGIPEDRLHLLNKSMDQNWLYTPRELGGGVTAYLDGFHQIHCLNLVRQYTYRDQYNYNHLPAFDQSPHMLLDHVEHCIEMMRIDLMCYSDETPYLIKLDDDGDEVIETNSFHRCRNFEKLIAWANNHIVEPYNATQELTKHADKHYEKGSSVSSH